MPIGAFRLNSLARLLPVIGGGGGSSETDLTAPTATYAQFGTLADDAWGGMVDESVSSNVADGNTVTLSMWIYPTLASGAVRPENQNWILASFVDMGNQTRWFLQIKDDGSLRWYKHWGGFEDLGTWLSAGTFTANTWHHLYISVSGSTVDVRVNGATVTPNNAVSSNNWQWSNVDGIGWGATTDGNYGGLGDRMAQMYFSNTYQAAGSNLSKFYDSGYVYMGPDGVASGAVDPVIFLDGDSSLITQNRGNTSGTYWSGYTPHGTSANTAGPAAQYPWDVGGLGVIVEWDNTIQGATARTRKTVTALNVTANNTAGTRKFGSSAMDHVGSTLADSWLEVSASSDFAWGTGDYTIEAWYKPVNDSRTRHLWDTRSTSTNGSYLYIDGSNNLNLVTGATTTTGTATIATSTFYHIATVRNGGTTKVYVDGVEDISVSDTTDHTNSAGAVYIGADYSETTQQTFGGYADEFRISNVARYTSAFTTLTRRFNNKANTLFLLHGDLRDGRTNFVDDNITG